jgi:CDP-glycerol glycerophosphotransferase
VQDYFERGMETAIETARVRFRPVDISQFAAVEVDFETDLNRANALLPGTLLTDVATEVG